MSTQNSSASPRFAHRLKIVASDDALTGPARIAAEAAANFTSMSELQYLENARPLETRRAFRTGENICLTGLTVISGLLTAYAAYVAYMEHGKVEAAFALAGVIGTLFLGREVRKAWKETQEEVSKPAHTEKLLALVKKAPEALTAEEGRFLDRVAHRARRGDTYVLSR